MSRSNICTYVALSRTTVVTNVILEWCLFFMNRCSLCIYLLLLRKAVLTNATFEWFFYLMFKDRHMRPKQVNCHSVHHGWTIFVFNNQHCILIQSINHFGGRWNVVALWPLLYTNCPTALPWLSAAGCVRAHPAQCDAQVKRGELISEVVFWTSTFFGRKTVWWKFWLKVS